MNALDWRKPETHPNDSDEVILLTSMHGISQGRRVPHDGDPGYMMGDGLAFVRPEDVLAWAPMVDLPTFLKPIVLTGLVPAAGGGVKLVADLPPDSPMEDEGEVGEEPYSPPRRPGRP